MVQRIFFVFFVVLQMLCWQWSYAQRSVADSLFSQFKSEILAEQELHEGWTVWDNETQEAYYRLLSVCTVDELLKYVNDSIPAVRADIISGIVLKGADRPILTQLLNEHLKDSSRFFRYSGDVGLIWSVSEIMHLSFMHDSASGKTPVDMNARLTEVIRKRVPIVPGMRHNHIKREALMNVDSLLSPISGLNIISYDIFLSFKDLEEYDTVSGNKFASVIKKYADKIQPPGFILVDNIKAMASDGMKKTFSYVRIRVK
jgi:hypothetical protein